jgi:hypothetical protein
MKYALLIYETPGALDDIGEDARNAMSGEYMALAEDSRCVGGAQLEPVETATTVRVQNGSTVTTDGPFADTKEVFGATTCSRPRIWMRRSSLHPACPRLGTAAPWRCVQSSSVERHVRRPSDRAGLPR